MCNQSPRISHAAFCSHENDLPSAEPLLHLKIFIPFASVVVILTASHVVLVTRESSDP